MMKISILRQLSLDKHSRKKHTIIEKSILMISFFIQSIEVHLDVKVQQQSRRVDRKSLTNNR
jgi:hypothetical protein